MNKHLLLTIALSLLIVTSLVSARPSFCSDSKVKVGLFYYVWYEGGLGNGHWNSSSQNGWTVIDTPTIGFYNSSDPNLIRQHLKWFGELGIDFLIISWWGSASLQGYQFADTATKMVFDVINQTNSPIKITLMVEDFNQSGIYDFTAIYDYIYYNYAVQYPNEFFNLNGQPLVCWWNSDVTNTTENRNKIGNDTRFASRIIGHHDYVDWYAWRPCSVDSEDYPITLPRLSKDGFTCIEPRYDDSHIGRTSTFDENYTEGLYDRQWTWELKQGENVSIIAIYSWNEYHERSEIEPHITNGTMELSPFTKTYQYITMSSVYQQYSSDIQVLQENYTALQSSYNDLQTSFNALDDNFVQLGIRYDALNASYASLQREFADLTSQYNALNVNLTALKSTSDTLALNLASLQILCNNLVLRCNELESNITSLTNENSALISQQNNLNNTLNYLEVLVGITFAVIVALIVLLIRNWKIRSHQSKEQESVS